VRRRGASPQAATARVRQVHVSEPTGAVAEEQEDQPVRQRQDAPFATG